MPREYFPIRGRHCLSRSSQIAQNTLVYVHTLGLPVIKEVTQFSNLGLASPYNKDRQEKDIVMSAFTASALSKSTTLRDINLLGISGNRVVSQERIIYSTTIIF